MTLDTIISLISTVALVYFCVGTYRIDSKLGRMEESQANQERHLQDIRDILVDVKREDL